MYFNLRCYSFYFTQFNRQRDSMAVIIHLFLSDMETSSPDISAIHTAVNHRGRTHAGVQVFGRFLPPLQRRNKINRKLVNKNRFTGITTNVMASVFLESLRFYPALWSVTIVICAECHACMCFKEPIRGNISFNPACSSTHSMITSSKDFPETSHQYSYKTTVF